MGALWRKKVHDLQQYKTDQTLLSQRSTQPSVLTGHNIVSENNIIMKARKEQSHCWHPLPVSNNQHFITNISLLYCLIATSIDNDASYVYIFHVALKTLSKTNYPFGPHSIPEQPVSQCIYYLSPCCKGFH